MRSLRSSFLTVIATLCLFSAAPAQPDTTRWTAELSMQYDLIWGTEISPDGEHVAYVVREAVMDETTSEFRRHIHVAAVDGSSDIQYTRGEHSNTDPKWSPDGSRLAFLSTRTEKPQVHVIRLRGGEAYAVTDAETGISDFEWGPEGERIAYTMTDPKPEAEKEREKEKRDVAIVNEEFHYDHLYTTEIKPAGDTTRSVQQLTGGEFHISAFDWSPKGQMIAFAHRPNPRVNSFMETDLSAVPADSGAVRPLIERPGVDGNPRYSPDGETIAFTSMGGENVWEGLGDVWTVPAEGGDARPLAQTSDRRGQIIDWTAGGEAVLVSEIAGTSTHVFAVPTAGDAVRRVTSGQGLHGYPIEAVRPSYSRSADRLAFFYMNSEVPMEVYVGGRKDFERRKITSVNADVPTPEMGRTELITWTGPGGKRIEGLLTYPVGYEEGERVPLVLNVHGGPAGVHIRSFTGRPSIYKTQVFAQNGYAVLRPNPRGSTGYGRAFRSAVLEDWGGGDFKDLMAGVDKTIEMGVAHPDSLAIMGWSYGGYMTAFAVTKTDRFQAASMGAGISNLISMMGTQDIPDYMAAHMGGDFWNNYETYEKHSAIYHIKNVTTPTQVLHGAEDERVHPTLGREFYRALRRRGVATEMVLYPRTPHGPQEPKLHMDVTPRIIAWFDEHLGRSSEPAETSTAD